MAIDHTQLRHVPRRLAAGPVTTCLTAGLANIAAAPRIRLTEVRSTVTGDIDLNGILGLDPDVRNGHQNRPLHRQRGTPGGKLRQIVEQRRARSAVYDILTGHVPVTIDVDIAEHIVPVPAGWPDSAAAPARPPAWME